jgi:hypothetical protein
VPRKSGDGQKLILRKRFGALREQSNTDWTELEKVLGDIILSIEATQLIDNVGDMFAYISRYHAPGNAISRKQIEPQIKSWLKATNSLRRELKARPLLKKDEQTREVFIAKHLNEKRMRRMKTTTPLGFLALAAQLASAAAAIAQEEINEEGNGPMEKDLWSVWVCLIAQILQGQGAHISASSNNKSKEDSPFVTVIEKLQNNLPAECQRFDGYESLAKGIQKARRTFRNYDQTALLAILGGFGIGIIEGYPGSLEKQSDETNANFKSELERLLATMLTKRSEET